VKKGGGSIPISESATATDIIDISKCKKKKKEKKEK
jgi:hypothetical protein